MIAHESARAPKWQRARKKARLRQRAKVDEVVWPCGPKTSRIPVRELVNPVKFSTCISRTGFFLVMLGLIVPLERSICPSLKTSSFFLNYGTFLVDHPCQ